MLSAAVDVKPPVMEAKEALGSVSCLLLKKTAGSMLRAQTEKWMRPARIAQVLCTPVSAMLTSLGL